MYEIDFAKCDMNAVIQRSFVCHPTLFVEHLRAAAEIHYSYSHHTSDNKVAHIALNMACDLRRVATEIVDDDFDVTSISFSERIQMFRVACKLQLVPHHSQTAIAAREPAHA